VACVRRKPSPSGRIFTIVCFCALQLYISQQHITTMCVSGLVFLLLCAPSNLAPFILHFQAIGIRLGTVYYALPSNWHQTCTPLRRRSLLKTSLAEDCIHICYGCYGCYEQPNSNGNTPAPHRSSLLEGSSDKDCIQHNTASVAPPPSAVHVHVCTVQEQLAAGGLFG